MDTIPTIDLSLLRAGERDRLVESIRVAYSEVGFAYLIGHGIPATLTNEAFRQSYAFHALPLDRKLALQVNEWHRGYLPFAESTIVASTVQKATRPNRSESLMLMHEVEPGDPDRVADPLAGPNQWPEELPGFRDALTAYEAAARHVALQLVDLVESALRAEPGALSRSFAHPTTFLRLLHYPPQQPDGPEDEFGSNPHTDYGFLTLLAQDASGGLQVRTPDGQWIEAPPRTDALVLNVGDVGERWSNGLLRSTPHRVVNRTGRDRYSIPYFFDPSASAVIEPLPSCVGDEGLRFDPVVYGAYLLGKLNANHSYRQAR